MGERQQNTEYERNDLGLLECLSIVVEKCPFYMYLGAPGGRFSTLPIMSGNLQ